MPMSDQRDWHPEKRTVAQYTGYGVGVASGLWGLRMADKVVDGGGINMWSVILVAIPFLICGAALFPGTIIPIAYRLIDKFMKDDPSPSQPDDEHRDQ